MTYGRANRLLNFIRQYIDAHGFPPTYREMAEGIGGTSTSVVEYHISRLEREGLVKRTPNQARSVVPVEMAS